MKSISQMLIDDCASPANASKEHPVAKPFSVGKRDTDFASLAGFLRSRGAGEDDIKLWLNVIDKTLPVPHGEGNIDRISHSIARYKVQPKVFTHDRFASYLSDQLKNTVMYCDGYGFMVYRDGYWQDDQESLLVMHLVRELVAELRTQVAAMKDSMDEKQFEKFAKEASKIESADFMRNGIKLMKSDPAIRVQYRDLNADTMLLNVANGTLDLRTMQLRPYAPEDKLTFKLAMDFDPAAQCPAFRKFLDEVLPRDVADFMLRVLGYALLGHGREHKFFILQGTGRNGKSTLLEVMNHLFGALMVSIQPESLNGRMEGAIRNDLARLAGKRFMITSETRSGTVLDAPLIKQITGCDTLTARFLHKEFFEFQARCVPFIITNYLPVVDGGDQAMQRRLCIVSFDKVIAEPDKHLPEKLKEEASGILNLVLAGMAEYQASGLGIPASVAERSQMFIERSNLLKGFFEDTFEVAEGANVAASIVYSRYEAWCRANGYKPMSMNQFKDAFERTTGLSQERNNQGRYWPNLKLRGVML